MHSMYDVLALAMNCHAHTRTHTHIYIYISKLHVFVNGFVDLNTSKVGWINHRSYHDNLYSLCFISIKLIHQPQVIAHIDSHWCVTMYEAKWLARLMMMPSHIDELLWHSTVFLSRMIVLVIFSLFSPHAPWPFDFLLTHWPLGDVNRS